MIRKIQMWLLKRWRWYRHHSLYVIADPADNSVTLSRALFNHMDVMSLDVAKVYVFQLSGAAPLCDVVPSAAPLCDVVPSAAPLCDVVSGAAPLCDVVSGAAPLCGVEYAFTLNPDIDQPTCLADIQYNSKHHSIGFESLCPTVNRIFYDYGLPPYKKVRLSIDVCSVCGDSIATPVIYYKILRPYDKPTP